MLQKPREVQHAPEAEGSATCSSHSHEVSMLALPRIDRKVFVIEVEAQVLCLETKLEVEQGCWVGGRHVKGDVFAHACLHRGKQESPYKQH